MHFLGFWCQKIAAAVAKHSFGSQGVGKLRVWEHFFKFLCPKIAPSCGEKHIIKSAHAKSDVGKLHELVARSTVVSQDAQNTCLVAHLTKFRCRTISQVVS